MTNNFPHTGNTYRVSLVALPDGVISTLAGIFDVMNSVALMGIDTAPSPRRFNVEIVGEATGSLALASGVPIQVQRAIDTIIATDIVIVPSVLLHANSWQKDRYPRLIKWLRNMHEQGAIICSACSGIFLLAETGLFDHKQATVHFVYATIFSAIFPKVEIHPDQVLIISGQCEELICSGASMSWHNLVLYLIARFCRNTIAQEVARLFALQWHQDGLTPYIIFEGKQDHGDAEISSAQKWLAEYFSVANAVDEMIKQSKLAERTFKRRFLNTTGITPIAYVQRLRIEDAKRRLERTEATIDEISWRVGYEDPRIFSQALQTHHRHDTQRLSQTFWYSRFCRLVDLRAM